MGPGNRAGNDRYHISFTADRSSAHRMYVISSTRADGGYAVERKLALPDDKWAIDGTLFTFAGKRWFVWSGWAGDSNNEQNPYLASRTAACSARTATR